MSCGDTFLLEQHLDQAQQKCLMRQPRLAKPTALKEAAAAAAETAFLAGQARAKGSAAAGAAAQSPAQIELEHHIRCVNSQRLTFKKYVLNI